MKEVEPAGIVRPAEDVASLLRQANAMHQEAERLRRKDLKRYREIGLVLVRAKEKAGHGNWLKDLGRHAPGIPERKAQRYMAWAKSDVTSDLDSADLEELEYRWQGISGNSPVAEEPAPAPARWQVVAADCLGERGLLSLAEAPRLIFADPPYNIGVDYGRGPAADRLPAHDYDAWAECWMSLCEQHLAPDGSLWVLINDEWAAEYVLIGKQGGLTLRNWIKWHETFGVNCADKFNRTSRHLLYFVKDEANCVFNPAAVARASDRQAKYEDARANPAGKNLDDVWLDIPRLAGTHAERLPEFPTQLPVALVERVICCATREGDLVVDPFSGSGTTGVAALRHGRRYAGFEVNPKFVDLSIARLRKEEE